jgi:hypothetical protein
MPNITVGDMVQRVADLSTAATCPWFQPETGEVVEINSTGRLRVKWGNKRTWLQPKALRLVLDKPE